MINPSIWNWNQIDAAGRHVLNTVCTVIATLAATHFITGLTPQAATDIASDANQIWHGASEIVDGIAGLLAACAPIYTALRSAMKASPSAQIQSVAKTLSQPQAIQNINAIADPASRTLLIDATSKMPEVKGIVTTSTIASTLTENNKVVATAAELPKT